MRYEIKPVNKLYSWARRIMGIQRVEKVNFDVNTIYLGHHNVTYRGIKAIRSPFDYLIYQMILFKVKPDLVIEIGTNFGGGALCIADILNIIGKGEVHSIDIEDKVSPQVKKHHRIRLFFNGFENYDLTIAQSFNKILVIDDGSHYYPDVLAALKKFSSIVSVGSYFIVEDGIVDKLGMRKMYQGGPLKAIREFLPFHQEFSVDRNWCDFFGKNATFNVNGYLERIK